MSNVATAYKYCVRQANINMDKYKIVNTTPFLKIEGTPYFMDLTGGSNLIVAQTSVSYEVLTQMVIQLGLDPSDFPTGTSGTNVSKVIGTTTFSFYDLGSGSALTTLSASTM